MKQAILMLASAVLVVNALAFVLGIGECIWMVYEYGAIESRAIGEVILHGVFVRVLCDVVMQRGWFK